MCAISLSRALGIFPKRETLVHVKLLECFATDMVVVGFQHLSLAWPQKYSSLKLALALGQYNSEVQERRFSVYWEKWGTYLSRADLRKWASASSYSEVWNLEIALQGMYSWVGGR